MARIKASENAGGQTAVITVDGAVVGGISMTGPGIYTIKTEGRVPAIDGINGPSPRGAWNAAVPLIMAGGVHYHDTQVQIGPDE